MTVLYSRFKMCILAGGTMALRTLTAVLHKEEDIYVATCPEVGTVSQGHSIEEAIANLKEATELYLEDVPLPEVGPTLVTTFEAKYETSPLLRA